MKKSLKNFIKAFIPEPLLQMRREAPDRKIRARYKRLTPQEIFTDVYQTGGWGKSQNPEYPFFSGRGSHDVSVVSEYIEGIQAFLKSFSTKPDIVDLGCGDFSVGSKIRPMCDQYIACDIVAPLIAFNRKKYQSLDVDFRVLDLVSDQLPSADIVFIRQVLQHLSNAEIERFIPKLARSFRYLVLTEHLPEAGNFMHNLEKPTGPDIRLGFNSGVVLTSPPFNLVAKDEKTILEATQLGGCIKTVIYELQD